jgi:hypothetical protein
VPIPKTFSPPGTEFVPSAEDALRTGVFLMFRADDLTRADYAYDADDESKGLRMGVGRFLATEGPKESRRIVLPQLLIASAFGSTRWSYNTGRSGQRLVTVVASHLEARDTSDLEMDTAAPELTPEARFARFETILMYGTIIADDRESRAGRVVDPYLSPLLEDGTYDRAQIRYLNNLLPDITRRMDVVGDIAVAYSLIAVYTIDVADRESPINRGFL